MRILITAGATREYIDPVRFISNASSGRMGYALVRAALKAGHKVTLITTVHRPSSIVHRATVVRVETAAQMFSVVKKYFPKCDCLIMAAAVADYTPAHPAKTKIKKQSKPLTIKLKPTPDILKWAGAHKNSKFEILNSKLGRQRLVVGFALEDKKLRANAEKKLREKKLDMIIANTPAAIGKDSSAVQVKTLTGNWLKLPSARKEATAVRLMRLIEKLFR
jgi:phosphopantothenoylcysteine decarboxylase/phosphopantothenate--cysteine ligase